MQPKSLVSPRNSGGWGVLPVLSLDLLVEPSLPLDKPVPGEEKKGLLGHQLFFAKLKGLDWTLVTLGGSQLNLLLSKRTGPRRREEKEDRDRTPSLIAGGKPSWPCGIPSACPRAECNMPTSVTSKKCQESPSPRGDL